MIELPDFKKVVSVLSGGLDSTILTYLLVHKYGAENVFALTYNYGQRHSVEIEKAQLTTSKLGIAHRIIDISFLGDIVAPVSALSAKTDVQMPTIKDVLGHPQPPTYVPYRNLILNSLALSFAESNSCEAVFTGLQSQDQYAYWDTSEAFVASLNAVSKLNRQNLISIQAPFYAMSKAQEIAIGKELGVPFEDTSTCYNPSEEGAACGKCPSCAERIMNFMKAGLKDPVPYMININW